VTAQPPPAESRSTAAPDTHGLHLLRALTRNAQRLVLVLTCAMLVVVIALGWFQYRQIDRVTLASVKGKDNIVWDFYKLEVVLMDVQMALREVVAQPAQPLLQEAVYKNYNVFASQVKTIEAANSGHIMQGQPSFKDAVARSNAYIDKADVYLETEPTQISAAVAQALLDDSQPLRTSLHRIVLEAYQVENLRATTSLLEMRRFTYLYGFSSFFLIVLTLGAGSLALRRMVLNERLQFERAEMLREKKEAAETANQAKAQFLSSASHDLRQPAHALGLFMDRLTQLPINPQAQELVASANAAVREMQDMLDAMFDLSHLDADATRTHRQVFAVQHVFDAVRSGLEAVALAKGLRLRIRPSAAWLDSDPALLRRILLNLVSNAIRYTPCGTVLVACRPTQPGSHMRLEVWDSGIGIAAEEQTKVFQEFYQVGNPQRDRRLGLGVGLSIVERCCRLLGHRLSLCSELGAGTRVCLEVPLAQAAAPQIDEAAALVSAPRAPLHQRLLLIEDDAMGRDALAGLLESWGYTVTTAESAQQAADRLHQDQPPDLVISDLRLGHGINGIEAIQMLRTLAGREIAACLISGDTHSLARQQAEAAGLVLLSKPVRPAKLRSLIRHLVQPAASSAN
jgi:signal transduction histidine kinase/CheY-like chemotaxis protein